MGWVRQHLTLYLKIIKIKITPHAPHVHMHTHVSMCVMMCVYSMILILITFYICIYALLYIHIYTVCIYYKYIYIYTLLMYTYMLKGFSGGSEVKNLPVAQEMQEMWV